MRCIGSTGNTREKLSLTKPPRLSLRKVIVLSYSVFDLFTLKVIFPVVSRVRVKYDSVQSMKLKHVPCVFLIQLLFDSLKKFSCHKNTNLAKRFLYNKKIRYRCSICCAHEYIKCLNAHLLNVYDFFPFRF